MMYHQVDTSPEEFKLVTVAIPSVETPATILPPEEYGVVTVAIPATILPPEVYKVFTVATPETDASPLTSVH